MKKFIFILIVLLWSWFLVILSFSKDIQITLKNSTIIDFREWEKLSVWDETKKDFTEVSLSWSNMSSGALYFHQISPIDGIYYKSTDSEPFTLTKTGTTNIVTFGSGLFVFNLQTGLEKYEFRAHDISFVPSGRGVFLVDTTQEDIIIFPFDTFLNMALIDSSTQSHVTNFILFPSLVFKHNPTNTSELKGADILRISLLDSIRYVDMNVPEDRGMVFPQDTRKENEETFKIIHSDVKKRFTALGQMYSALKEQNNQNKDDPSFFYDPKNLLINDLKKEIFLKNNLIKNIAQATNNAKKTGKKDIENVLTEMQTLSPQKYIEGIAILKKHYYLGLFTRFIANQNGGIDFSMPESLLVEIGEKIIKKTPFQKQGAYYAQLSDLFSVYYFFGLSQQDLNAYFEKNLQKILYNKALTKNEFLPFVFFVTQYLSTGPGIPNENTLRIINHLFQITNEYYIYNQTQASKLTTTISTIYYNYTKIFSKIYNVFLNTFIDKTDKGLLLKENYRPWELNALEDTFKTAFSQVVNEAKNDTERKKDILYANNSLQSNPQVVDSYTLLKNTLASLSTLVAMFDNYSKYLNDFKLNESNKSARGILVEDENLMSIEILNAYLGKFNNLDISSLRVLNNFKQDNFYEVQVKIMTHTFNFRLWGQWHLLTDISYTNNLGEKQTFPNIIISLDQKEEQLQDLLGSTDDPILMYKYDFKNFFEMTFLKNNSTSSGPTWSESTIVKIEPFVTPEIQLFIQKELLDKDFKNIYNFLPIGFKNIQASIDEQGDYVIALKDISKWFQGQENSYNIELESKYIFKRHTFSRIMLKLKQEEDIGGYDLNETLIEILPARIALLSLPDTLKDLGYYLDALKWSYNNQKSITIDLVGKKILLDALPVIPKFPTPE